MSAMEIWDCALECDLNGISEIFLMEERLPPPFEGAFARLRKPGNGGDIARITVNSDLEPHWKEFAVAKELMHCWSPEISFVGDPATAGQLVSGLTGPIRKFTDPVVADISAQIALAEVMLPSYILEKHIAEGTEFLEIATRHGIHPEVAELICRAIPLHHRKNGFL